MATVEEIRFIHALLNNTRAQVVMSLIKKANNISGLLQQIKLENVDRSTLCYHLNILEEVSLIKSKYVILEEPHSKGRAGRFYEVDKNQLRKAMKVFDKMRRELSAK